MADSAPLRPPLALIANDQEWSIRSLESLLTPRGYAIIRAYQGKQALQLARDTAPDVVIVDAHLPDMTGVEVCLGLQNLPRFPPYTPIFITTSGRWTRRERVNALEAGAWDYIGLPLDAEVFLLRLEKYLRAKFEADRALDEGLVDGQTGLYNLRGLMRRTRELGSDAYRNARPMACIAFAVSNISGNGAMPEDDKLWSVVDHVARVFSTNGRTADAIGRIRLTDFAVIAPGTNEDGAFLMAQRIISAAESSRRDGLPGFALLAGYHAVGNMMRTGTQPAALLAGATTALRQNQAEPGGPVIRRYEVSAEAQGS